MSIEIASGRPLSLLRMLYAKGKTTTSCCVLVKQSELAQQLDISRQALNVHLRKLRQNGCVRTGRGFIDVTEKGLAALGVSTNPAFVFIKFSPIKSGEAYQKLRESSIERVFKATGDVDAVLVVEREKLDATLKRLASIEGIEETKSCVTMNH